VIRYGVAMPSSDPTPVAAEPLPVELAEVGTYRTATEAFDHALVVLAAGGACWLVPENDRHRLLVEPGGLAAAREQLARYDRESTRWPPPPLPHAFLGAKIDWRAPLAWAALVLAAFWAQSRWPQVTPLGALDAQAFVQRVEWWRAATALFLHADADHVLANLSSGIFVFAAVGSILGRLRGWVLLVAASILSNATVALLSYPAPYRSLGASTAVFAGLGLLTGHAVAIVARADHPHRWRATFVPFAAGLTVLALYGAGGQNVDLGAHAVGFLIGGVLAFLGRTRPGSAVIHRL